MSRRERNLHRRTMHIKGWRTAGRTVDRARVDSGIVADPPGGRISPPLTAEGEATAWQSTKRAHVRTGQRAGDCLNLWYRCISLGVPRTMCRRRTERRTGSYRPRASSRSLTSDCTRRASSRPIGRQQPRRHVSHVHGRCERPLGGRHARRRDDATSRADSAQPRPRRRSYESSSGYADRCRARSNGP